MITCPAVGGRTQVTSGKPTRSWAAAFSRVNAEPVGAPIFQSGVLSRTARSIRSRRDRSVLRGQSLAAGQVRRRGSTRRSARIAVPRSRRSSSASRGAVCIICSRTRRTGGGANAARCGPVDRRCARRRGESTTRTARCQAPVWSRTACGAQFDGLPCRQPLAGRRADVPPDQRGSAAREDQPMARRRRSARQNRRARERHRRSVGVHRPDRRRIDQLTMPRPRPGYAPAAPRSRRDHGEARAGASFGRKCSPGIRGDLRPADPGPAGQVQLGGRPRGR